MTVKELKDALSSLDDNAIVLIPTGYSDYEDGEFYEADIAGAGYCDPDSDRTDGLYICLHCLGMLPEVSGECFRIVALCRTNKRNDQGGVPVYDTG